MITILPRLKHRFVAALTFVAVTLATGCRQEEVRVYRIPKEEQRVAPALARSGPSEQIRWGTPSGWEEREAGGMRAARFVALGPDGPAADVSVIPMPGVSASRKDIVNLWREQVKLSPISEADLAGMTEKVEIAGASGELFELVSTEPLIDDKQKARILVAMLNRSGTIWFFKMTGEDSFVSAQRPAFLSFLKSASFVPGSPAAGPASGPPIATAAESGSKPEWDVPSGWREVPPTQMLLAKFRLGGDDTTTEVSVSVFPGDVGGVPANVNRWRDQIGLAPVAEPEVERLVSSLDVLGGKAMLVDMTGEKGALKTRLIGIIVPRGGQTWFYKMMGDPAVAEREKAALLKFVQTVRYSNA